MNHDMAHCKGDGCMMNNTCRRYHAHLEYQADTKLQKEKAVPYCDESECLPRGYALYMKGYDNREIQQP
jgi:hypothetical protein